MFRNIVLPTRAAAFLEAGSTIGEPGETFSEGSRKRAHPARLRGTREHVDAFQRRRARQDYLRSGAHFFVRLRAALGSTEQGPLSHLNFPVVERGKGKR